jgi:hypothetical protein
MMVFGGRISVKYALRWVDVARLDTFRASFLFAGSLCDFHNIRAVGIRLKRLPEARKWFDPSCQ